MHLSAAPPYSTHGSRTNRHLVYFSWLFFFFFFVSFLGSGFNYQLALGKCAALGHGSRAGSGFVCIKGAPHAAGMPLWCTHSGGGLGECQRTLWDTTHSRMSAGDQGRPGLPLISIKVDMGTLYIVTNCIFEVYQYYLLQRSGVGRQIAFSLEFILQECGNYYFDLINGPL